MLRNWQSEIDLFITSVFNFSQKHSFLVFFLLLLYFLAKQMQCDEHSALSGFTCCLDLEKFPFTDLKHHMFQHIHTKIVVYSISCPNKLLSVFFFQCRGETSNFSPLIFKRTTRPFDIDVETYNTKYCDK